MRPPAGWPAPRLPAVATDPAAAPVFVHRQAFPHLAGRDVAVDCRRRLGLRHFVSDLPPDFGLRASLGRLSRTQRHRGGETS